MVVVALSGRAYRRKETQMQLELISFPLCPYVQRSVITLRHKQVPFRRTDIDLDDPPAWFDEVSPLGLVPVLRVDDKTSLFESAVINEFLDEVTTPRLLPDDPIERAQERGWIAHASTLLGSLYGLMLAEDRDGYEEAASELLEGLEPLERFLDPRPLYRGPRLSLADAAFAPLFSRLEICHELRPLEGWPELGKVRGWARSLGDLPEVRASVAPTFAADLVAWLRDSDAFLTSGP
jgi:glutathione S-transferase